jgi:hypothetical protein
LINDIQEFRMAQATHLYAITPLLVLILPYVYLNISNYWKSEYDSVFRFVNEIVQDLNSISPIVDDTENWFEKIPGPQGVVYLNISGYYSSSGNSSSGGSSSIPSGSGSGSSPSLSGMLSIVNSLFMSMQPISW